jgi:hypothetical protein
MARAPRYVRRLIDIVGLDPAARLGDERDEVAEPPMSGASSETENLP